MNPGLWGLMTAFGWGGADFIARFTGRALGYQIALFGMLSVGAVVLTLVVWLADMPLVWDPSGWWLVLATGVGVMVATLLLYLGLARGPVTIVAPIVGSYPAFNVVLALALGVRPSLIQWSAMAVMMMGVIIVAASDQSFEGQKNYSRPYLRHTIWIALASSFAFAVTIAAAQHATPIYGELQTVWMARWISLLASTILLACIRKTPRLPMSWWPLLILQGLLDGGAYVALLAGSHGEYAVITAVVASSFSAVTVVLARIILREPMTWKQWGGIVSIIGGVAVLSAQ